MDMSLSFHAAPRVSQRPSRLGAMIITVAFVALASPIAWRVLHSQEPTQATTVPACADALRDASTFQLLDVLSRADAVAGQACSLNVARRASP